MDLKKITAYLFIALIIVAFGVGLHAVFLGHAGMGFDWVPVLYWAFQLAVFLVGFGVGYYFYKQATVSDWDAKFKELVRRLLVENPQLRAFGDRLEESKQWLMKRDSALDAFRKDYLARANALLDGERKLA